MFLKSEQFLSKMKNIVFALVVIVVDCSVGQNVADFICTDGLSINMNKICNGNEDCSDGSDEVKKLCYHTLCAPDEFRCHYGGCVSKKLKCDDVQHCADGSDESQCGRQPGSCEKNEYKCSSGECIPLSKLCDYTKDCTDNSDEKSVCNKIYACPPNTHRCKIGGCIHLTQRCDGHNDCIDGSDESAKLCAHLNCIGKDCEEITKEKVRCPSISLERINAHCENPAGPHKGVVSCHSPLPPGAIMRYECKPYYTPKSDKYKSNKHMICQSDGTWDREHLRCVPDCGIAGPDVAPLIVKGWISEKGKYPWHAVLYSLSDGNWTFVCGGTLITEKIVLTAAHCTWQMKKEMLQIGLGKYHSDYNKREDYSQIRNLSKVIQQPLYQDLVGNYGSDISILVLEEPVEFSPVIRPACIDWNLDDITGHLSQNSLGLIVGMGVTENDTSSDVLRGTYLQVVEDKDCIRKQNRDFKKYITFTSFCAGWRNGTGVCNGDSGGGLVFPLEKNPNKFMLQGIVSISPRRPGTSFCDTRYYTVFTKVGMYVKWIFKILKEIHEDVKYEPSITNVIM